jgi:ubiquinone/menaquinone biosynthesis C-methylase UbiE
MSQSVNYDRVSPGYDRRYAENRYAGVESLLDEFTDEGQAVLEVGCGTGHWIAQLRSRGCAVVGLDRSSGMLRRAVGQVEGAALLRGRAEALPFLSRSFERVLVVNALHHFDEPARFSTEAHRLLRPGGRIVVVGLDPSKGPNEWFIYDYFPRTLDLDKARYPSTAKIMSWLEAAGFGACSFAVAERIRTNVSARDYLDRGVLTKESTSQLTLLEDKEYEAGITRIRTAVQEAEARGEDLKLRADLCLYATFGTAKAESSAPSVADLELQRTRPGQVCPQSHRRADPKTPEKIAPLGSVTA